MNSRIYLQPDAIPNQEQIRTANRLFRHFTKEVTFLQQPSDSIPFPDITMSRLRWAIINFSKEDIDKTFTAAVLKAPNIILDLANCSADETEVIIEFQKLFDDDESSANLVIIKKSEEILELAKDDQSKAKRK